ncbi:PIR protein [Plasmodium malariae]|uniref:PIR protein n=1 Tax=Plasmodium malariae TaxID=5858 RepID=A0A1D3JH40_PLAMA|nr:PIR protein [Plasmodium malariae]XP_028861013.1 PIR protein [Plasmodium malariae]SBT85607.1 PIR protein [Plasmodium malariae]SCN12023.1 PIR protein [Plasmodium malariae]
MTSMLEKSYLDLLSSKNYEDFESSGDNHCYGEEDKIKTIKSQLNSYNDIKSVEDKILHALCFISFSNNGPKCNEQCYSLYYWIGNKLFNILSNDGSFSDIITTFDTCSKRIAGRDKCKCDFFGSISKEEFNKMKIVYEYCKYHDTIEETLQINGNMCDRASKEYLDQAINTYNEVYETCNSSSSKAYCEVLMKHVPKCFSKKLLTLKYKIKEYHSESIGLNELDDHFPNGTTPTTGQSTYSISQILMLVAFPLAGILFISFILYKFTPIVSWINTKLIRKKLIKRSLDDSYKQELTEYISTHVLSNLRRREVNVAYHPA